MVPLGPSGERADGPPRSRGARAGEGFGGPHRRWAVVGAAGPPVAHPRLV